MGKLKSLSLMPSPNQALETFREESGLAPANTLLFHQQDVLPGLLMLPLSSYIHQRIHFRGLSPGYISMRVGSSLT